MTETIREPARETPVIGRYDVAVLGGGVAGLAAAVAAARRGARTLLIEHHCVLGGLATEGLVAIYLPICDGRGRQVMAGLAEEMLRLSARHAPTDIPECWSPGGSVEARHQKRYLSHFAPHAYMIALEDFALENGVKIFYDTRLVEAVCRGDALEAVIVESRSGREAVRARVFIDATGDAELCHRAGQATVVHRDNARAAWFYADEGTRVRLVQHHAPFTNPAPGEPLFGGDSRDEVTDMLLKSRPMIMQRVRRLRQETNNPNLYPVLIGTIPQLRFTRCLAGAFELDASHVHQWIDDAVTLAPDWRAPGPVYAVPYRCLVADRRSNLLVAGRCISSTRSGGEITRAIPVCVGTGEAAGTAAAIASQADADLRTLDVPALQQQLRRQGQLLDPTLVTPAE